MGLTHTRGRGGLFNRGTNKSSSSWKSRYLALEYTSRSGNQFLETLSKDNLNATILTSAGNFDATHYAGLTIADFGSGVTSITGGYVECRIYIPSITTNLYVFGSSDTASSTKAIVFCILSGKPAIRAWLSSSSAQGVTTNDALSIGWHTIRYGSNSGAYYIVVDGITLTVDAGLIALGNNDGKFIGDVPVRDNITIGYLKRSTTTYSNGSFYLDYIDFNGTNKWIVGRNSIIYDNVGGSHIDWTTTAQFIWDADAGRDFIDLGFTVWTKAGAADKLVPYSAADMPYDATTYMTALGYVKEADYSCSPDGLLNMYINCGDVYYNSIPCVIGFNELGSADSRLAIFDRSNTTYFEDIARTALDYDATSLATKCRFHSSIILKLSELQAYYKVGYKYRVFPVNDSLLNPTKITGFLVAKNNLS